MAHDITDHELIAAYAVAAPILASKPRILSRLACAARIAGRGLAHLDTTGVVAVYGDRPFARGIMPQWAGADPWLWALGE